MQDSDGSDAGDGQGSVDPRTARVVKKGILSKKSRSKFMSGPWTLRTFILGADNKLYYYDGKVFKGEVVLSGTSTNHIASDTSDTRSFPFQITNIPSVKRTQCNSLTLSAGSFQEADDWVSCINTAAAGSGSSGPSGYVTMEEMAATSASSKVLDARELKEKRLKARNDKSGSKDNLLKYGEIADFSDGDDED